MVQMCKDLWEDDHGNHGLVTRSLDALLEAGNEMHDGIHWTAWSIEAFARGASERQTNKLDLEF